MSFSIVTDSLPDAFVGVPYIGEIIADGVTETGSFSYEWTIAPKGGSPVPQPIIGSENITSNTGLPNGLTWSANGNIVTISGSPVEDFFGSGSVLYPSKRNILEVRVTFTSDLETVSTIKEVSIIINRVINESTAKAYLDTFQESNGFISEEKVFQAIDGIAESNSDPVLQSKIINDFSKNLGDMFIRQDENGEFNAYYEVIGLEEPV